MRIRKKPWAENEFNTNKNYIKEPENFKGKWKNFFKNENPIHIEIGCGKGQFISEISKLNKNINYIAIERQDMVIASALKKSREKNVGENLAFFSANVEDLKDFFIEGEIARIYINFCDPWPNKKKWAKRRLTHRNFLKIYGEIFGEKGEIHFKTDNRILFEFSLNEFAEQNDWKMKNISLDLHNSDFKENIMTEYEEKFSSKGMPIFRLEADYKKV